MVLKEPVIMIERRSTIVMDREVVFDLKAVGDIKGDFYVPSYQRGYRWGKTEVVRLLDDIYATGGKSNYCLQPIVLRRKDEKYEVVDGQQRLTTLYLIYRYMNIESNGFLPSPQFSLFYETRDKQESFLKELDFSRRDENIDFWFICNAYESIQNWFESKNKQSTLTNINRYFDEGVKIIWYEVATDSDESAIGMFTRLNVGRIPLTNAELVKAMFISESANAGITREKKEEIALQWDNIERELHNDSFWYFLTNTTKDSFQTRIDLVLDLIANKPCDTRGVYYTFFKFDSMRSEMCLEEIWRRIQHTFLILKDWYENHELFHKIGYLIASEYCTLQDVYDASKDKTKEAFGESLDDLIRDSIKIPENYSDLSYENATQKRKMTRLLLLFNVESVRRNGEKTQWFPFNLFKMDNNGRVVWSLEHIHAQQSKGLRKQEDQKEWIRYQLPSIQVVDNDSDLVLRMQAALKNPRLTGDEFNGIQEQVERKLSVPGSLDYLHCISNMALLNARDNAALNNSTFDVKRTEIVNMDKKGQYIPFCTKMVFLKYYTKSSDAQLHFWGPADREDYINAINIVLQQYLQSPIHFEKQEM